MCVVFFCSKELETGCPARGMLVVEWVHEWMWYKRRHKFFCCFFLFYFCSQSPSVTTVLCSFLKTSQEGSKDLQLGRKRHLLHPSPEAGEQDPAPRAVEMHPDRAWWPPAAQIWWPLLSSDAAATGTSLQRHQSYNGATAVPLPQPALFKKAGLTATASLMMETWAWCLGSICLGV